MRRKDFLKTAGMGMAGLSVFTGSQKKDYDSLNKPKRLKKGDRIALTARPELFMKIQNLNE